MIDLLVSDYQSGALLVRHGKGNKERTVPVPQVCRGHLDDWLKVRKSNTSYLFTIPGGRWMAHGALHTLLEEVKTVAGYRDAPNIKPHSLRHFYATHLLQSGADLKTISALLGHSHLHTTAIYCHTDNARIVEVAELATLVPKETVAPVLKEEGRRDDRCTERPRLRRITR